MEERRPSVLMPSIDPALEMTAGDIFWQEHGRKLVVALVGIVLLILATGLWFWNTARVRASAEALYSTAKSPEDWREVIKKYPGSIPAGNAMIELSASLRAQGNLDAASTELENLVNEQPAHPMAATALLTLGEIQREQGKKDAALESFRTVSSKYKDTYAAPLAMLAEADFLAALGSQGEARAVLESIGSLYPSTPAAMVSAAELSRLGKPAETRGSSQTGPVVP